MAGIYIHIPFCKQACSYCNFHFSVNTNQKAAFIGSLLLEIALRKDYLAGEKIETIYLGGGTPSLLTADELKQLFDKLQHSFQIEADAEITLEANPDDLTREKIRELKQTGINRFSIGIQSFHDDDLKFLNRAHHATQAEASVKFAQDAGFENITIDLIYGIPDKSSIVNPQSSIVNPQSSIVNHQSSIAKWLINLEKLAQLNVPHFSAYCLTVEPKTILEKSIREKKSPDVDDAEAVTQFETLMDFASAQGYEHYEISNFAKPGSYSRHNTSYWTGKKYLGLGPSAHSFDGESRQWNIANNTLYAQSLEKGKLLFEKESLTVSNRFNEYIMTSLRTKWGIDRTFLKERFGDAMSARFDEASSKFIADDLLVMDNEKITLSRPGKLIADRIISDLFD